MDNKKTGARAATGSGARTPRPQEPDPPPTEAANRSGTPLTAQVEVKLDPSSVLDRLGRSIRRTPLLFFKQDSALRYTWIHPSISTIEREAVIGRTDLELYPPLSARALTDLKQHVLSSGESVRREMHFEDWGEPRSVEILLEPVWDTERNVCGLLGVCREIGEERRVKDELDFQKYALDQHAIVAITDCEGRITYANDRFCTISGFSRDEIIGETHRIINAGYHPRAFFVGMFATIATGGVWRNDICNRAKDGRIFWVDMSIVPMRNATGKVTNYVAISNDITDRKEAEATRRALEEDIMARRIADENTRVLTAELDHRVKNSLAVVLSLAQQTARNSDSLDSFQRAFTGRVRALARTHAALAAMKWVGASLLEILRVTLEAHIVEMGGRVSFRGPNLTLSHRAASVFSLMFNELATNAVKYGALSGAEGSIQVAWHTRHHPPESASLVIEWIERGGPRVAPPTRAGVGTQFIKNGVEYELDGRVSTDFDPAGVRCTVVVPCASALAGCAPAPVGRSL